MKIEDFKKAKIEAMKAKDSETVTALNAVINKLMLATIEKRAKGQELIDADVISILQKTEKELLEERAGFEKAGREQNIISLDKQLDAVKKYLPQMMTSEEIKTIILSLDDKSVPSVMRHFKSEYAGKCDMKVVGETLKNI